MKQQQAKIGRRKRQSGSHEVQVHRYVTLREIENKKLILAYNVLSKHDWSKPLKSLYSLMPYKIDSNIVSAARQLVGEYGAVYACYRFMLLVCEDITMPSGDLLREVNSYSSTPEGKELATSYGSIAPFSNNAATHAKLFAEYKELQRLQQIIDNKTTKDK